MYQNLREKAPVYKSQTGEWIVSSYAEVKMILKDPRFKSGNKLEWINRGIEYFESKDQDLSAIASAINTFLLLINPPEHTRIRKFVTSVWDDKDVDKIITGNVELLLKKNFHSDTIDIVEDFARPLPSMTICGIMGISFDDYQKLTALSNSLVKVLDLYNSFKDLVHIEAAAKQLLLHFDHLLQDKKQNLSNDLISKIIIANRAETLPLTDRELISLLIFLFIAGQETTVGLISTGLMNLSKYPDQSNKLLANPDLLPCAIEELLRYDGPVHLLGRIADEDITIDNSTIKKGETVTLCLASANRDSVHFDTADTLDIERHPNRHLAFGSGIHFCLGDWLAKRQGIIALGKFIETYPNHHIDTSSIAWNKNLSIRTLKNLPCSKNP